MMKGKGKRQFSKKTLLMLCLSVIACFLIGIPLIDTIADAQGGGVDSPTVHEHESACFLDAGTGVAVCDTVVVKLVPAAAVQIISVGEPVNLSCTATFLDGHEEEVLANLESGFTPTAYNTPQSVILSYGTRADYADNAAAKTCVVKVTIDAYHDFTATVSSYAAGSITANVGPHIAGESCNVSATPYAGYLFSKWTVNGSTVSTDATYSFLMPNNDIEIMAVFVPVAGCYARFTDAFIAQYHSSEFFNGYGYFTSKNITVHPSDLYVFLADGTGMEEVIPSQYISVRNSVINTVGVHTIAISANYNGGEYTVNFEVVGVDDAMLNYVSDLLIRHGFGSTDYERLHTALEQETAALHAYEDAIRDLAGVINLPDSSSLASVSYKVNEIYTYLSNLETALYSINTGSEAPIDSIESAIAYVEKLLADIAVTKSLVDEKKSEFSILELSVAEKEQMLKDLLAENADYVIKIADLQAQIIETEAEHAMLENAILSATSKSELLQGQLAALQNDSETAHNTYSSSVDSYGILLKEVEEYMATVEVLATEVAALDIDVSERQSVLSSYEAHRSELQSEYDQLVSEYEALQKEYINAQTNAAQSSAERERVDAELADAIRANEELAYDEEVNTAIEERIETITHENVTRIEVIIQDTSNSLDELLNILVKAGISLRDINSSVIKVQ